MATKALPYVYDDGGRAEAGYRGAAGDCGTRAWAIALGLDYETVRQELMEITKAWQNTSNTKAAKRSRAKGPSVRNGTWKPVMDLMADAHGWAWKSLKTIGSSETWHLNESTADVLGTDTFVARVSRHFCAVQYGIVRDSHDPRRIVYDAIGGFDDTGTYHETEFPLSMRMVYGVWVPLT